MRLRHRLTPPGKPNAETTRNPTPHTLRPQSASATALGAGQAQPASRDDCIADTRRRFKSHRQLLVATEPGAMPLPNSPCQLMREAPGVPGVGQHHCRPQSGWMQTLSRSQKPGLVRRRSTLAFRSCAIRRFARSRITPQGLGEPVLPVPRQNDAQSHLGDRGQLAAERGTQPPSFSTASSIRAITQANPPSHDMLRKLGRTVT